MYFCSGPPRTYAVPQDGDSQGDQSIDRVEDVAVAIDPLHRVVARVSSTHVSLWAVSARSRPFHSQRRLVSIPRSGRFVASATKARESLPSLEGVADGGCADLQLIWAVWVTGDRLAVVERGSQVIEFYAFDGLPATGSIIDPFASPAGTDVTSNPPHSPVAIEEITGRFVDEYPLNQGDTDRDRDDVAWTMSGVDGGKYLFIGMESGIVSVVDVVFVNSVQTSCALWKIDVLIHLQTATASDTEMAAPSVPSCYSLTTASWDPVTNISMLALIACFEGGKCFIMLVSPKIRSIDQLLSLVNTERDASASCYGRCTTAALDQCGSRLALGWSDGGVSLFRLALKQVSTTEKTNGATNKTQLQLEPIRELTMSPWGYTSRDIGGVTALAWTHDTRALAVGYELRGFAVFSTDGCRLMSSLPQHNNDRPVGQAGDGEEVDTTKEVCTFGVLRLLWSAESTSLLVTPRGQPFEIEVPNTTTPDQQAAVAQPVTASSPPPQLPKRLQIEDVCERVEVPLFKEKDGLCLSLSGAPGRCGAWVRSDTSFTKRKDGGIGPAEASNLIHGGDLLVAINGNEDVVNLPFEMIIQLIKGLPDNSTVVLVFLRLRWDIVYPLAVRALSNRRFLEKNQIRSLLDDEEEEMCIREYALRMQEEHGDCEDVARPPLLDFESRAKFEGWEAIQGTTKTAARHKYIKLMLALFPVWSPMHILHILVDFDAKSSVDEQGAREDEEQLQLAQLRRLGNLSPRSRQQAPVFEATPPPPVVTERRRRASRLAFAEYDFARSVPLCDKNSKLVLLEDASIRRLSSPSLDDPCALVSAQSYNVPPEYDSKCCPLRLVAMSKSGQQIAVAGQRGFCLLNLATGKWRMFGNVHEEQDLFVHALHWIQEDVIVASYTRFREQHKVLHIVGYPRNHLDQESVLASLEFPRDNLVSLESSSSDNTLDSSMVVAMESDDSGENVFCLLKRELWCLGVTCAGILGKKNEDIQLTLTVKRQVKLPSSILDALTSSQSGGIFDITIIPRVLHIGLPKNLQPEDDNDSNGGWLSSIVNMIAGGEVPDQYKPEEVLPRFAFLTSAGDVIVWDPENRSQRLLCSNITTVSRLFVTNEACETWPTPCRLMYGLYGPEGMRLWLPLLDGVYLSHTKAFEQDENRLQTFLACHDPLRAKTYEIEFGTAPATAELYEHVVKEYDIDLESFVVASITRPNHPLEDGVTNLGGCIATVDDPASRDIMLRFDADVTLLGIQQAFGLLVGVSQDVYMPPGALTLPCYDVFSRVQPFFHSMLNLLVRCDQLSWAKRVLAALRGNHFALSSPSQELFLHSMLEACFSKQVTPAKFQQAIELLRDSEGNGDLDEYCEIVAHVARKSEPSRLKLLFPAAGDPLDLIAICRQRGELRTAANFLLVLEECSDCINENLAARNACAAELVAQCIEQNEWMLAKHVVRVAREWVDEECEDVTDSIIDEQLAKFCWQDLISGRYERVVMSITELQASLPQLEGVDIGIPEEEKAQITQRIQETFVDTGKREDLEILAEAVKKAKYDHWTYLLDRVVALAVKDKEHL